MPSTRRARRPTTPTPRPISPSSTIWTPRSGPRSPKIPPARRKVITTHDAFGYFGDAYGIAFIAPEGVSTEAEPSARDVADIIAQIRQQNIPAVFLENITNPRLMDQIARETGASIGGTLYSDALSPPGGAAPTYIDMIRHNVQALAKALAG